MLALSSVINFYCSICLPTSNILFSFDLWLQAFNLNTFWRKGCPTIDICCTCMDSTGCSAKSFSCGKTATSWHCHILQTVQVVGLDTYVISFSALFDNVMLRVYFLVSLLQFAMQRSWTLLMVSLWWIGLSLSCAYVPYCVSCERCRWHG